MNSQCLNTFVKAALICVLILYGSVAWSQEKDSLQTEGATGTKWLLSKPPSGSSEKTQGVIAMVLGGISAVAGIVRMSEDDPCKDISGPGVICTSNIDEVRTIGAIQLGVGAGAFIFGVIRYSDGVQKAKAYEEWKKRGKESSSPK